jgi:hypothetical protein
MSSTAMKDLLTQQANTQREFEAAREHAEKIANGEAEALGGGDETYIRWIRAKKLAEREAARLEAALATVADEIEAEAGRRERDELLKQYNHVKSRNRELQARLAIFQTDVLPEILRLLRDLAQDELDVENINRRVPGEQHLRAADHVVRCIPSVQATEMRFFRSAEDIPLLRETIVLPRFDQNGGAFGVLYDGRRVGGAYAAVQHLDRLLHTIELAAPRRASTATRGGDSAHHR